MEKYQSDFIRFAIDNKVLCFGDFTLKSGRQSPYFFNSGLFNDGASLARLGEYYAQAIIASGVEFDMVFGPAYKGIPLGSALAIALANRHNRNVPYSFNRKEAKDHGEGGITLGAELRGRVLIVDDVISAGTSVNLSVTLIRECGAEPVAVAIALDRQERGDGPVSATRQVEQQHGLKVINIISLENLIEYLVAVEDQQQQLEKIENYRKKYGI
ncbi:MAG: orotate phosphoribosyltransferase [Thiotrichales bacterium]|nr:orotate phosphoribosyltransferase [Thiotrichales bacterium]